MFGLQFIKVDPTDFVIQYKHGQIVREGTGLSFFYFAPTTSLVRVPVGSAEAPFIFEEVTADFQSVTVQGQLTYRVVDAKKLSQLMNYTLSSGGRGYASEDPRKLPQRLIDHAQVLTRASLKSLPLREALGHSENLVESLRKGMSAATELNALGIEVLGFSILAIKPTPETARALEAQAREQILREADEAIYARRNSAVEQERAIKENELNTEIAVENKKRQIREAQMDAEKSVQQKQRELQEAKMEARIVLEEKNAELVSLSTVNARTEADSKAYAIAAMMQAYAQTDAKVLEALLGAGMEPGQLIAQAFKGLSAGAEKIGQLNITPDLLQDLLANPKSKKTS